LIKHGDLGITLEQNEKAWNMFRSIVPETHVMPLCLYDSSKPQALDLLLSQIDPIIRTHRDLAGLANFYCHGIGSIFGNKMVVVGEAVNKNTTWLGLPFDNGGSSEFLYSCMREAQVPEPRVYLCNAKDLTVEEAMFIRQGETEPWLALGDVAHKVLNELSISHSHIPHPQYWKRFKSNQRAEYVAVLKKWLYDYMIAQNSARLHECSH
jgi:hypothetical protein